MPKGMRTLTKRFAKLQASQWPLRRVRRNNPVTKPKHQAERTAPPIRPLNADASRLSRRPAQSPQVVVLGPAGTGKTWIAATFAADLYRAGQIAKIILTRPNVPCGRSLGFFPGSLEDKFAPWAAPIVDAIKERIGAAAFEIALKNGDIEMAPFEVMRGRSWRNAFVLLDEAQNATAAEIKTFLTRIGEDCTVVVNGDVSQMRLTETLGPARRARPDPRSSLPVPVIEFTPRRYRALGHLRDVGARVRRSADLKLGDLRSPRPSSRRMRGEAHGRPFRHGRACPTAVRLDFGLGKAHGIDFNRFQRVSRLDWT